MVSKGQFTRIDTSELKARIFEKIGHKRSDLYFNLLNRYLNSKISKSDFGKLCIRTVGRENLSLHNRLIRSICDNASLSKVPPPKVTKPSDSLNVKTANGYQKKRSPVSRDQRKFRERPSPLGPLGKTRSPTTDQSPTQPNSLSSRPRVTVEEGEEVEQVTSSSCVHRETPILAPLGFSYKFNSSSRVKNLFQDSVNNCNLITCQRNRELPDPTSLRNRLEQRLLSNGVGVSEDCVKLLSYSLNVYLKRLIEPGMVLARSRSGVCMSMLDFRASLESNPLILGENWPTQLEKICSHTYEK